VSTNQTCRFRSSSCNSPGLISRIIYFVILISILNSGHSTTRENVDAGQKITREVLNKRIDDLEARLNIAAVTSNVEQR
jgi:hypothetical protein